MNPPNQRPVLIRNGIRFDAESFVVMAGPCAVESRDQILATAQDVAAAGASMLRGGAFKPRTSPDSFQGLGWDGVALLAEASAATGLPVVTEVMDPRDVERMVTSGVAMLQVGSRSMQNYALLREVGQSGMPVLLKRGNAATIDEFLAAAEYVYREGNDRVVLCERGVRGFDPSASRNLLDLTAVPVLQSRSSAPVVVDPSHATGRAELIVPMARAALAAGADGLLIEVHPDPQRALSDGRQALVPEAFAAMMRELAPWLAVAGRKLTRPRIVVGDRVSDDRDAGDRDAGDRDAGDRDAGDRVSDDPPPRKASGEPSEGTATAR